MNQPANTRSAGSTEPALAAQLTQEGLVPGRWSNGPDAVYSVHDHPYGKVLVVTAGSITFTIEGSSSRVVRMGPGDRLELPAHTPHSALVGPEGVVCLEAHLAAGNLHAS